jgi:hypothetical protein
MILCIARYSEIQGILISIYDVYELGKSRKKQKMITHLLKGLKGYVL